MTPRRRRDAAKEKRERPRLTYFDMRGRAEAIRLFLHATRTGFEDTRIVSRDTWQVRSSLGSTRSIGRSM
jgi:hypothetical protein